MKFLFRKQRQVQLLMERYLENLRHVQQAFTQAINSCLADNCLDDFMSLADETHHFESKADDVRLRSCRSRHQNVCCSDGAHSVDG